MAAPSFVHLRMHSEFSIADGIVRVEDAVDRAVRCGMPALGITDLANLFGMLKFYRAARARGIKPVLGCDLPVAAEGGREGAQRDVSRIALLARNRNGYGRLCELLTEAYLTGRKRDSVAISRSALASGDNSGLIALSGASAGDVGRALAEGRLRAAEQSARRWAADFPGAYYIEVQRFGAAGEDALVARSVALAGSLGLPVVATHPIQFLDRDDFKAHEARVCIAEGYVLADSRRPRNFTPEQWFKPAEDMAVLFADIPEALANSVEIARRCNLSLELGRNRLPDYPVPQGVSIEEHLAAQACAGLERRLERLFPRAQERAVRRAEYDERLAFEIRTIQQMGFAGYFLIVADFINWAKANGVPVGPGRGSGAGSLVAYSLGITELDPLAYGLLFERFLNPERVSMPDFDIDFCQDGRDRVIEYVKSRYGAHAVSQIATFGSLAAKAVIRDVGRVLDLPFNFVDQFAKLIPNDLHMTLAKARAAEPLIGERLEKEEELRSLWSLAERLEGLTRNVGMHAGGVVIAPGRLTDFCPLYSAAGPEAAVSQFDKDDVERIGLVKFDFLGLRTLTILAEARRLAKSVEGIEIDLERLPLDDAETYERIFRAANTTAVFQFESRGMKDMLVQAKPECLEDLIALNALYRPGPMELIPSYIARKQGRERVTYLHPRLEKVLANTYGIMVYQEQVMQCAQALAGYSLGGADELRRAIGKKKAEEMARQREIFVAGAQKNGVAPGLANEIFDHMEKFAGYGFNKSHAAAYSFVAYQTAWLKCHHPAAFMAATLSSEMADTDKVHLFVQDALANGLAILPPDINAGGYRFEPTDARSIRYGLGAIKGTGQAAIDGIVREREHGGPYADLFDLCRRVDKRLVNRRVIEALVRAGCFDSIDPNRAALLASVGLALNAAEQASRNSFQDGLFDSSERVVPSPAGAAVPAWSERERLRNEKQALGFFLSGHPYDQFRSELSPFVGKPLAELVPAREPVLLAGIVMAARTQMTRRGKMLVAVLDDGTARQDVSIYQEVLETQRGKVVIDELLAVEGKVQSDDFSGGLRIVAENLMTLAEVRGRHARALRLSLNGEASRSAPAAAEKLRKLLAPYRNGPCPVRLAYRNGCAECELPLGESWRVHLEDGLLAGLRQWLSAENVQLLYD
ncbi:MAG: DNA polymerase III subunit alpha [Rhodocyclaceae bacterium]